MLYLQYFLPMEQILRLARHICVDNLLFVVRAYAEARAQSHGEERTRNCQSDPSAMTSQLQGSCHQARK